MTQNKYMLLTTTTTTAETLSAYQEVANNVIFVGKE